MTAIELSKSNEAAEPAVRRQGDVFAAIHDEVDRLFDRFERGWPRWSAVLGRGLKDEIMVPELDVHENSKQVTIDVNLPGVHEKDVTVTLANGMMTIKGEKKSEREENKENYYLAERSYGAFERSLRMPETIDDSRIEARFDKGVLRIVAQKKPEAIKAEKKIEIKKV